jgi:hypothetical protein
MLSFSKFTKEKTQVLGDSGTRQFERISSILLVAPPSELESYSISIHAKVSSAWHHHHHHHGS